VKQRGTLQHIHSQSHDRTISAAAAVVASSNGRQVGLYRPMRNTSAASVLAEEPSAYTPEQCEVKSNSTVTIPNHFLYIFYAK